MKSIRLNDLTTDKEQRALFLSAKKEKGKYTEGVLLSATRQDYSQYPTQTLFSDGSKPNKKKNISVRR